MGNSHHILRTSLRRVIPIGLAAVVAVQNPLWAVADTSPAVEVEEVTEEKATPSVASKAPMAMSLSAAAPSVPVEEQYDVEWYVRYTDKETHSKVFAYEEHGFVPNGSSIFVGFNQEIYDAEGNIWTTDAVPGEREIWGPGIKIIYIEYELTGHLPEEENPYAEAEELLGSWIQKAKEADAELMNTDASKIQTSAVVCETEGKANLRLLSAAGAISDADMHTVYVVSKNIYATGICLKDWYGKAIIYSNDVMEEVTTGDGLYRVQRFIIKKTYGDETEAECLHTYVQTSDRDASCLVRGVTKEKCEKCGDIRITYHAPLGHIDSDGDSVCDRCGYRVFEETVGQNITSTVNVNGTDYALNWTLVDDAYQGGCLYIADSGIPASEMGGYGSGTAYESTPVFDWLSNAFSNDSSIKGETLMFLDDDGTTSYAQMLSQATAEAYRPLMAAGDYVTHTASGSDLVVVHDDGTTGTVSADSDVSVRMAMLLSEPIKTEASLAHWNVGDRVTRTIDGVEYGFTCVDENYSDIYGNHTFSALFLMDDVIPAGYGGEYKWEIDSTGHSVQVWYPGPVANFGDSNNYKYSNVRAFLDKETVFTAADVVIGTPNAYTGATADNKFGQTDNTGLSSYTIGYQQMTARLFILSVEEALKYRQYLWRFNSSTDNPAAVTNSTCGAYWLRTPNGTNNDYYDTGMCYCVDLLKGNIHPEYIKPAGGTGDPYIDTQTTVGIRPAFTLPNR